jgi:hypothetical protein
VLYITNGKGWMIVVPSPTAWLPAQVVELVRTYDTHNKSRLVDWRILNAKTVDYTNNTFLPYRARKHQSLSHGGAYDFPSLQKSNLYESAESMGPSLYGDVVDLDALFRGGEAKAKYTTDAKKQKESKRAFAKKETAASYIFSFDDKILNVHGPQLRAFRELGFTAVCPRDVYAEHEVPPLGLRLGDSHEIFGFMMPLGDAGVFEDRQGRTMFADAARACWDREDVSLGQLCDASSYTFKDGQHRHLGDILEESWGMQVVKRAVTSLMWKGWEIEDIDRAYEDARYAAYCVWAESMQTSLVKLVEELSDRETATWRVRNIESEIKRFCDNYEAMGHLAEFDLGHLPQAISLLGTVLQEMEHHAIGA